MYLQIFYGQQRLHTPRNCTLTPLILPHDTAGGTKSNEVSGGKTSYTSPHRLQIKCAWGRKSPSKRSFSGVPTRISKFICSNEANVRYTVSSDTFAIFCRTAKKTASALGCWRDEATALKISRRWLVTRSPRRRHSCSNTARRWATSCAVIEMGCIISYP